MKSRAQRSGSSSGAAQRRPEDPGASGHRRTQTQGLGRALQSGLDGLYLGAGMVAAGFIVIMLVVIILQMAARWTGLTFPGSAEYAGYSMAAASFLAFAHTLQRGAHIRVGLVLSRLGRYRWHGEVLCFAVGSLLSGYLAWYAVRGVWWSYRLGDVSQGQDATPLWIPQLAMAAGSILLALAFLDHLVRLLVFGAAAIPADTAEQSHAE